MMRVFVVAWIVENVLVLPYSFFIAAFWRPHELPYYWATSEVLVAIERSFSCTIPIVVFFLTLDRSVALTLGLRYRAIHSRFTCALCYTLSVFVSSVALYLHFRPKFLPDKEAQEFVVRNCIGNWCYFIHSDAWQFMARVVFGTLNVFCSLLFIYSLHRHQAKTNAFSRDSRLRNSANNFIIYAVASEILLNFLPHGSCLVFQLVFEINIAATFGTWSRLATSLDALFCAIMYYRKVREPRSLPPSVYTHSVKMFPRKKDIPRYGNYVTRSQSAK